MSSVRNGLSTLNRLLGKKNKDVSLSKSTTNLTKSSHLDTSSQHNKIVPLVAASNNAPFEQTFRIKIYLPRDQLFVIRVGAKTKLDDLLNMVCTNKQLDREKYEFRHPEDNATVFRNESTIGEVGLNELRLCLKVDRHDNFKFKYNQEDVYRMKAKHYNNNRDSISSSDLSSRNSLSIKQLQQQIQQSSINNQQYVKSTSPYSSTNSLNSIDSSGMSGGSSRGNMGGIHPPAIPIRKKRTAPRPPSQNSIPENHIDSGLDNDNVFKRPNQISAMPRKNFHVSTPNLTNNLDGKILKNQLSVDPEHLKSDTNSGSTNAINRLPAGRPISLALTRLNGHNNNSDIERDEGIGGSTPHINHSRTSSESSELKGFPAVPEPTPRRKCLLSAAKKKAPAPPPRGLPPIAPPRNVVKPEEDCQEIAVEIVNDKPPDKTDSAPTSIISNVSKVMLNVDTIVASNSETELQKSTTITYVNGSSSPTIEAKLETNSSPSATTQLPTSIIVNQEEKVIEVKDNQLHSPAARTTTVYLKPSENNIETSSQLSDQKESTGSTLTLTTDGSDLSQRLESSDEEETKIYSIKMGKPIAVETAEIQRNANINLGPIKSVKEKVESEEPKLTVQTTVILENRNLQIAKEDTSRPESPLWTYTLPAPKKFADDSSTIEQSDRETISSNQKYYTELSSDSQTVASDRTELENPIKPIIKERLPLDFQVFSDGSTIPDGESVTTSDIEDGYQGDQLKFSREALLQSLEQRRDQLIENEFHFLINEDDGTTDDQQTDNSTTSPSSPIEVGPTKEQIAIPNKPTKSNVINELNDIINNNQLDSVIRKPSVTDDVNSSNEIESLKRSSLTNFKIQTYTNHPDVKTETDDHKETVVIQTNENRINGEEDMVKNHPASDVNNFNQFKKPIKEYTPTKRPSLTNGHLFTKSNRVINRSGSFHSTYNEYNESKGLTPRSSAYVSLTGSNKFEKQNSFQPNMLSNRFSDTNRPKSSSELSIADSPSLQSLIVIKSILSNSRQNNLNQVESSPGQINNRDDISVRDINKRRSSSPGSVVLVSSNNDSSKENSPNNQIRSIVTDRSVSTDGMKINDEPIKQNWKYQGKPAINLSTWGERPKSHVCIQNDKDYNSDDVLIDNGNLLQQSKNVDSNYQRNSIDSHTSAVFLNSTNFHSENRLPIVRGVEYKKHVSPPKLEPKEIHTNEEEGTVEKSIDYSNRFAQPVQLNRNDSTATYTSSYPFSQPKNATLNRFTPVVRGFKTEISGPTSVSPLKSSVSVDRRLDDNSIDSGYKSLPTTPIDIVDRSRKPNVPDKTKRPVTMNWVPTTKRPDVTRSFSTFETSSSEQKPIYSQFTLRKTGLKDKILADTENQSQSSPTNSSTIAPDRIQMRQLATKSTVSIPPPPPMQPTLDDVPKQIVPPIVRGVVIKKSLPPQLDTRDQLLDAIRSFNRGGLKKKGDQRRR